MWTVAGEDVRRDYGTLREGKKGDGSNALLLNHKKKTQILLFTITWMDLDVM